MEKLISDYDDAILKALSDRLLAFSLNLGCPALDLTDFRYQIRKVVSAEVTNPTVEEKISELVDMIDFIKSKLLELGLGFKLIYLTKDVFLRVNSKEEVPTSVDIYSSFNLINDIIYFFPNEYLSFESNIHNNQKVTATNNFILGTAIKLAAGKSENPLPGLESATFKMHGEIKIPKGTLIGLAINKQILNIPSNRMLTYIP